MLDLLLASFIFDHRSILMLLLSSRESTCGSRYRLTLVGGQLFNGVLTRAISRHLKGVVVACRVKRLLLVVNTIILVGIGLLHVTVIRLPRTGLCLWVLFTLFACLIVILLSQNPTVKSIVLAGALGKHRLVRVGVNCRVFREIQTRCCR